MGTVGGRAIEVPAAAGPGALILDGLAPGTEIRLRTAAGRLVTASGTTPNRTLVSPPGEELYRFATVSDLHIGERSFGYRGTIVERPRPVEHHPERATRAALAELEAWGAQSVIVKGDITHGGKARQWDRYAAAVADCHLPLMMIPGNHDTGEYPGDKRKRRVDRLIGESATDPEPPITMDAARRRVGLEPVGPVQVVDVPGLRILAVDTTVPGQRAGQLDQVGEEVADRAAEVDLPVFVALHHQLLTLPVPHHPPPGIPANQSRRFLDRLRAANPAAFVTSGHTHRHRRRTDGTIVVTEVGSPKDYPGTWGGYVVHEGGIRQVVRRVTAPDILAWTDRTAAAALGAWGWWSPGTLPARCFTHIWPSRR
jgi:predicted phosphodiesterase